MRYGLDDDVRESLLSFSHKQVCGRTRTIAYALFVRSMQRRVVEERMDLPWPGLAADLASHQLAKNCKCIAAQVETLRLATL